MPLVKDTVEKPLTYLGEIQENSREKRAFFTTSILIAKIHRHIKIDSNFLFYAFNTFVFLFPFPNISNTLNEILAADIYHCLLHQQNYVSLTLLGGIFRDNSSATGILLTSARSPVISL